MRSKLDGMMLSVDSWSSMRRKLDDVVSTMFFFVCYGGVDDGSCCEKAIAKTIVSHAVGYS